MSVLLLDQDGVMADFEGEFLRRWRERYSDKHPGIEHEDRRGFHLREDYPVALHPFIGAIQQEAGFFRALPPLPGAVDAFHTMSARYDTFLCTSPLSGNRFCPSEKFEWVEEHLGTEALRRVILAKDKTLVHGDVLVDDKPTIVGIRQPSWKHVIYDAPYNQQRTSPSDPEHWIPRIQWTDTSWRWRLTRILGPGKGL